MTCGAELHIADDHGDNYATCACQLEQGHELPHRHVFQRDFTEVVVTFYCDERERCDACMNLASEIVYCNREHPMTAEVLAHLDAVFESIGVAVTVDADHARIKCRCTVRPDPTLFPELTQVGEALEFGREYALSMATARLQNQLEEHFEIPCWRSLCPSCLESHDCKARTEDEP
jgi:hypothetical protein